jgi:hypothetical protein
MWGKHLLEPIAGGKNTQEYCKTTISHETWLWVELGTNPLHARYKLYQLFQAHLALKPDTMKTIMAVIYLDAKESDAVTIADHLRDNQYVKVQAEKCNMHVAIAWTNHQNIYVSMLL